ncbi:TPA: helix-turn-helix domain-containing protein [Escherichia coli]|nr:helix-turn-helix domain-containing protein [Escherichia coli]EET0940139.1 helix-turn-helix domain-containing protein [Escherichia coli]EFB4203248.1 helix-turn-helix domain-containing protein [Escherichia coli]EFE2642252.1 helix-turn-helix domain-containing protein [Escherichia coli]EFL7275265.1 helix-turn-helix domain-containing protein [Escherichia coli]
MFISCVPSKATPLILRAFASLLAATAVPFDGRAFAALFTVSRKLAGGVSRRQVALIFDIGLSTLYRYYPASVSEK